MAELRGLLLLSSFDPGSRRDHLHLRAIGLKPYAAQTNPELDEAVLPAVPSPRQNLRIVRLAAPCVRIVRVDSYQDAVLDLAAL
jgi:hypothetical protein